MTTAITDLTAKTISEMMEEEGINEELLDACEAYLKAGLAHDLSDFEECYCGQWDDDEDFAKNVAEDTGALLSDAQWPNYCIDWEYASEELMHDYTEQDGYYFRNI